MTKKATKSTPKKKLGIGSTVLCTFHSPQPYNIDPAWQQTRDWGSQISEFCLGLGEETAVFFSPTRLREILKSHHLQARVTLAALCVPTPTPTSTFVSAVIRFFCLFFIVLTASGGARVP